MHRAMCISLARITCVQQEAHGITPSWPHCISWAPPDFWMHLLYHLAVDTTILCSQSCLIPQEFQAKLSLLLFLSGYSTAPVLLVIIPHLISKASVCSLSSGYLCETHWGGSAAINTCHSFNPSSAVFLVSSAMHFHSHQYQYLC